jgi:transposase-like protein
MPEQRRRFSPQFKAEAVQMVIETGCQWLRSGRPAISVSR